MQQVPAISTRTSLASTTHFAPVTTTQKSSHFYYTAIAVLRISISLQLMLFWKMS